MTANRSSWKQFGRWLNHPDLPALVVGIAIAIGVCLPFLARSRLLLLDWSVGPHATLVPAGAYGLNGGLTIGTPLFLIVDILARLGPIVTWLVIVLFFPIAAFSMSRLVRGSSWRRVATATLYCANPFVFERLFAGHVGLLLGYALLPLAVHAALRSFRGGAGLLTLAPALWWALLTACSPHFGWIYGAVLVVVWLTHHPLRRAPLGNLLVTCAAFVALSAYVFLPHTITQLQVSTASRSDLLLYRTSGDPHLGLFPNALGLYGFWRLVPGPHLPKDAVTGWLFVLLALLFVVGIGAFQQLRPPPSYGPRSEQSSKRRIVAAILLIGVVGYLLALGDQGPTGSLFRWAYFHVPFFAVMREPEKFLLLTAFAYAVFFGYGVEYLVGSVRGLRMDWRSAGAVCLAIFLPLGYTPTIFDGLAGQIGPSRMPSSWSTADRAMGNGPGQILFLPFHLYMAFPFTNGRVIANPAPTSFRRSVIAGDNVEAGGVKVTSRSPRSAYLQDLFARGPTIHEFGALVQPLGVAYVVLAKTVDWRRYFWLDNQPDLKLVLDSSSLKVWRNTDYASVGQASLSRRITQISPIAYAIGPGQPGELTLDAAYQKGWQLGNQIASQSPQGTIQFRVGRRGGIVRFTPWGITRLGYIISGTAFVLLSGLVVRETLWRRKESHRLRGPPPST